jgi:hypothetical protein
LPATSEVPVEEAVLETPANSRVQAPLVKAMVGARALRAVRVTSAAPVVAAAAGVEPANGPVRTPVVSVGQASFPPLTALGGPLRPVVVAAVTAAVQEAQALVAPVGVKVKTVPMAQQTPVAVVAVPEAVAIDPLWAASVAQES